MDFLPVSTTYNYIGSVAILYVAFIIIVFKAALLTSTGNDHVSSSRCLLASFPGSLKAGAERRAWYTLSAHASNSAHDSLML